MSLGNGVNLISFQTAMGKYIGLFNFEKAAGLREGIL